MKDNNVPHGRCMQPKMGRVLVISLCVTDPIRVIIDNLILAIIGYSNWNWVDDTQRFQNEKGRSE